MYLQLVDNDAADSVNNTDKCSANIRLHSITDATIAIAETSLTSANNDNDTGGYLQPVEWTSRRQTSRPATDNDNSNAFTRDTSDG